jgi:hypothetical protein
VWGDVWVIRTLGSLVTTLGVVAAIPGQAISWPAR